MSTSNTTVPHQDRLIFLNLAIKDLTRTRAFFEALGFGFDPRFSNAQAACMVLSDKGYVMLLEEAFFKGFTDLAICDTATQTECLICFSCTSREELVAMCEKAFSLGARPAKPLMDHGFMVGWSFYDLDGHHWELSWMDMANVPGLDKDGAGSPPDA